MNIITNNRNLLFLKHTLKKIIRSFSKQEKVNAFGPDKSGINRIFVINLDRQKERWQLIQKELNRIEVKNNKNLLSFTERFSAIDAENHTINTNNIRTSYKLEDQYLVDPNPRLLDIIREKDTNIDLTKQEIAVAESHISIWNKISNQNINSALILEDDVYFENKFSNRLNCIWEEIIESKIDFDIIYLSYKKVEYNPNIQQISNNLSIPIRGIWWFSGYLLSNKGAKKLLDNLPIIGPIDLWINHKFKDLKVLISNDSIINQKLFLASDNNYSILPVLSQIGINSNKTFIDLEKLKGQNPVFIFGFSSNIELIKLKTLLSLNSYRTYYNYNISSKESHHLINLINNKEALLFDAYIGFNLILDKVPFILDLYPNAIIIILQEDNYLVPKTILNHQSQNIFLLKSGANIAKKVSRILKIKYCRLNGIERDHIKINPNFKTIKEDIPNNYKYLEHDVNPWILPIEKIRKYLPYGINIDEIIPIAKQIHYRTDDFKKIDWNFWDTLENSFPSNLAQFSKENFRLSHNLNSGFQLDITENEKGNKKYSSASIVSKKQFSYGSFEISMKPIKGEGIISAFFLHRNDPWQEIDIEFLGYDTTKVLLNVYFNPGEINTQYNYGVRGTPVIIDLGFDASQDFHDYRIEWEYHEIRWYVDNKIIHLRKTWSPTPIPNLPMAIFTNAWITNSEDLAGKFNPEILPQSLLVRYIKIYNFDYIKN